MTHDSRLMTPPRVPPGQNLSRDGWDARPTPLSPYPSEKARASSSRSSAIDSPRAITSGIARGRSRDIPRRARARHARAQRAWHPSVTIGLLVPGGKRYAETRRGDRFRRRSERTIGRTIDSEHGTKKTNESLASTRFRHDERGRGRRRGGQGETRDG